MDDDLSNLMGTTSHKAIVERIRDQYGFSPDEPKMWEYVNQVQKRTATPPAPAPTPAPAPKSAQQASRPKPEPSAQKRRCLNVADWKYLRDSFPELILQMIRRCYTFKVISASQLRTWCEANLTDIYYIDVETGTTLYMESEEDEALVLMRFGQS